MKHAQESLRLLPTAPAPVAESHAHSFTVHCQACSLASICLPVGVTEPELEHLDRLLTRGSAFERGDHLFRDGGHFDALYAVRSGAFKSYCLTPDGEEQVVGFHLPGEVFGLDGIAHRRHTCNAVALETASVCKLPYGQLSDFAAALPSLQGHLFALMSEGMSADHELRILLGRRNAEERIAAFLMSLSARHERRRLSGTRFRLPMSRRDLGNYLGLVIETVSRVLTRLQKQHVLVIDGRDVEIVDPVRLHAIAGNDPGTIDGTR